MNFQRFNMVENSVSTQIFNLRMWRANKWMKYDTAMNSAYLKLHYDQLLITTDDKVLESLSLSSKLKGICKQDCIILIINTFGKEVRKIKFQIKDDVESCIKVLGTKFPIVPYNVISSNFKTSVQFQSMDDILKIILDKQVNLTPLPPTPGLDNFVKLCLLDPLFPQVVMQVQAVLEKEMSQNN